MKKIVKEFKKNCYKVEFELENWEVSLLLVLSMCVGLFAGVLSVKGWF